MSKLKDIFFDKNDGAPSDAFYFAAYFVLVHLFFWKFLVPGQMVFGTDIQNQSYPLQHMAVKEMIQNRSLMLWNPYIFSGMPFLASFSFPFFYPGALLFFGLPLGFAMGYEMVLHFFLMGVFTYMFLRYLRFSRQVAFVGGLIFMFNIHCISLVYPGHGGKIFTMTFLPLAFMYLDRGFRERPGYNFAMLGLLFGLMFYGGHPQILFYCGIALSLFFIVHAAAGFRHNGLKGSARLAMYYCASVLLGVLLYSVILFPALEYRSFTHRAGGMTEASSYKFATSFSPPPEDLLYLPLRNPFGWGKDYGPRIPTTDDIFYRGRMGLKLNIDYMGVFVLVLCVIGTVFVRNRYTWFFAGLALLSMFLALGGFNPLYVYVYKYVPGFSLFRVPYAIMILIPICWAVLSSYGLQHLLEMKDAKNNRWLLVFIAAAGALTLAVLGVAAYWRANLQASINSFLGYKWVREMLWGYYGDVEERFTFFLENVFIFVILMAVSLAALLAYRNGWLKRKYLAAFAALFILIDTWPVGWDFIKVVPNSSVENVYFRKTPKIDAILKDKDGPFRVFSLVTNNELLYYGIESLTGYHAVLLSYYERALGRLDMAGPLLDLLNAKYLMLPGTPEHDFKNFPDASARETLAEKYELIDDSSGYFYRNRKVLPRAFLVSTLWVAQNEEQSLMVVTDRRFKPGVTAVIAEKPDFVIEAGAELSGQSVRMTPLGTDALEFEVKAPADSFMVVSEVWYPGWKAYLDGVETKIYRTDYLIRGVFMPAGEHTLKMVFDPPLFKLGAAVSLLTLGFLVWYIWRERRKGKPGQELPGDGAGNK